MTVLWSNTLEHEHYETEDENGLSREPEALTCRSLVWRPVRQVRPTFWSHASTRQVPPTKKEAQRALELLTDSLDRLSREILSVTDSPEIDPRLYERLTLVVDHFQAIRQQVGEAVETGYFLMPTALMEQLDESRQLAMQIADGLTTDLPDEGEQDETVDWRALNRQQWDAGIQATLNEDGHPISFSTVQLASIPVAEDDEEDGYVDD